MAVIRATDPDEAAVVSRSRYVLDSGFGIALFDAKNGFNEVNRYLMLCNRYCHQNIVYIRDHDHPGKPPFRILSR
jgi:hypothetical protein